MKAKGYKRVAGAWAVLLGMCGMLVVAAEQPEGVQSSAAGFELLVNGDFEGPTKPEIPSGWFKAMSLDQTIDLRAGIETVPERGNVAFIEQAGVKAPLCNNWAQRLRTIPVGATVRVAADVKTENLPANTGFIVVQCWDSVQQLLALASTQSMQPLGGTEDWRQVSFEFTVPQATRSIIVRCGLAESGKIWFDNVSLQVVAPAVQTLKSAGGFAGEGFEVTEQSLGQLERVSTLSHELVQYARQQLGANIGVRTETFAQGGGRFQVVLLVDWSKSE